MPERTFGWIQDPGNVKNLRKVVEVFDPNSETHKKLVKKLIPKLVLEKDVKTRFLKALAQRPLKIKYKDLVGTGFKPRPSARCNGIIQATIEGQKRPFIADWPADNFMRWAQALGLIEWNKEGDTFSISESGLALSHSLQDSDDEYAIYEYAFLSYPPTSRILSLLYEAGNKGITLTKFELGRKLGFIGEEGFSSISLNLFIKEYSVATPEKRSEILSNWEGDSDKYARMICSWLSQLKQPWIETVRKTVEVDFGGNTYSDDLQAYTLTKKGLEVLKRSWGKSKFSKVPKLVNFEMLCTKGKDKKYLRTRRSYIIEAIKRNPQTIKDIRQFLAGKGLKENSSNIEDDLKGLANIGLTIQLQRNKYHCSDSIIGLVTPRLELQETRKSDILALTEKCRIELKYLSHDYLVLIPLAFDSEKNRDFELKTIELLTEECKFGGLHLGGSNRPDGIIYSDNFGVIIDTKAYSKSFNIPIGERDKMIRYINDNRHRNTDHNPTKWWEKFPPNLSIFIFLFVSGKFGGNFKRQLEILSEKTNDTLGSAITAYNLLKIANQIVGKKMTQKEFKNKISCLNEVII